MQLAHTNIHQPKDYVLTKSVTGEMRAYEVTPDGTLKGVTVADAPSALSTRQEAERAALQF